LLTTLIFKTGRPVRYRDHRAARRSELPRERFSPLAHRYTFVGNDDRFHPIVLQKSFEHLGERSRSRPGLLGIGDPRRRLMSELFRWHVKFPDAKTLSKRAEECRLLATVCPEHLREPYLEMAAGYEQLAKQAEKLVA
jgi:hypothetical protein